MRHWLTTHFPHHVPGIPWHVFLTDKRADAPENGDTVFFFETGIKSPHAPPGSRHGAAAILRHGIINGGPVRASAFGFGRKFEYPCRDIRTGTPIPFAVIVAETKLRTLRGSDGLFNLDDVDYRKLLHLFI